MNVENNMLELVGVDTGGTFTDFILYKNGSFVSYKIPSTPDAPEKAIIAGLKQLQVQLEQAHIVHGTTVATNALLEGKGAKTAFITNRGLKHLLLIGRQSRQQLYSLCPSPGRQLIQEEDCFEIDARVDAQGEQIEPVSTQQLQALKDQLHARGYSAVAICMLFSFLNSDDEQRLATLLQDDFFVSRSSLLFAEQREYERAVITWLNSYLGPVTQGYLHQLQTKLKRTIHVMQSDATTLPAARAGEQAVRLLLSGPAGGVMAARVIARSGEHSKLLTLDMGGTSTDVALIDGQANYTNAAHIGEFPLAMTQLDIHTIGAGGGSIARVDAAGGLHVGPQSAGAQPGPACYGHGGSEATLTDANVVLGRLPVTRPLASGLQLDKPAAERALAAIAQQMDCSLSVAAQGMVQLANAHMAQALRVISIHRGHDPRHFSLFPFGGAAGLHMCAVAQLLGMQQILIPRNAGILSALGMLYAPVGQMRSRSICRVWEEAMSAEITRLFAALQRECEQQLHSAGIQSQRVEQWLELRYQGQSSTLSIAWHQQSSLLAEFAQAHSQRYGYALADQVIELVTLRVWVYQDVAQPEFEQLSQQSGPANAVEYCSVVGENAPVAVFIRAQLGYRQVIQGPCVIVDDSGTLYIEAGWSGEVTLYGHIRLQLDTDCP